MTPANLFDRCLELEKHILSRGFMRPEVAFFVNFFSGRPYCLKVEMRTSESYDSAISFFPDVESEHDINELFLEARKWIAKQKDPKTIRREQFIATLGRVIDEGHAIGFDVEFMNPLVESMKRLSENVLEYHA